MRNHGYRDPALVRPAEKGWTASRIATLVGALLLVMLVWYALDQKLLHGGAWISETYDNEDWRTNEGNLHTYGAWDLEAHIWKTEYAVQHYPNANWNPYWYLGMPLFKYYQQGFYVLNWLVMIATGTTAARATVLMIIWAHLAATLLTFLLCYLVSRRIWVSALCSVFLLSNTFISLRSYGWEPITVVFLWLYPIGLMLFLRDPLRPLRFWMIIALGLAYLCHPLLWFSLCMFMGLYLLVIALRETEDHQTSTKHYIWQYLILVLCSVLVGAVQFFPQVTYEQVTSGAHMGVKYLPFYQVPPNIITVKDFFLDAGNLKGPGPIIMIAFFLLIVFAIIDWRERRSGTASKPARADARKEQKGKREEAGSTTGQHRIWSHEIIVGASFVLLVMVLFYYLELYNIFPMNLLRSIQYHRIIPEFIITAALLVATLSNVARTYWQKAIYYTMLVVFVLASMLIVYNVQTHWQTTDQISQKQEFLHDTSIEGRISFPYPDQSLSVRNSFTRVPQTYGYYEQGITNPYNDEIFSVSSGFHNTNLTLIYLKAANVGRLYVNMEEGERDRIVRTRLNTTLTLIQQPGQRYAYFAIPLADPSFAQAVSASESAAVKAAEPGCRELFRETYCGSKGEEFVSTDPNETAYLDAYVHLLERPYAPTAKMLLVDPDHYDITVRGADADTAVVVKMTYDKDFRATVDGHEVPISTIGPDFMLIAPGAVGDYTIKLTYRMSRTIVIGAWTSVITVLALAIIFLNKKRWRIPAQRLPPGDL